jgi:hypothetical protein
MDWASSIISPQRGNLSCPTLGAISRKGRGCMYSCSRVVTPDGTWSHTKLHGCHPAGQGCRKPGKATVAYGSAPPLVWWTVELLVRRQQAWWSHKASLRCQLGGTPVIPSVTSGVNPFA